MTGIKDRVYQLAPVPIQNLMVSAYGLYWKRLRFGGNFEPECEGFRKRERFDLDIWERYITAQLQSVLTSAFEHAPHYQQTWSGVTLSQLGRFTLPDLPSLPVLEKQVARDNPLGLLLGGKPQPKHLIFHTSGSTGTPVKTYWLPSEMQRSLAMRETRSCGWANVSFKIPRATFSGRMVEPDPESKGPFYRFNMAEKQVYFSAFHLRPETASFYVQALKDHGIQWMTGYSNSFYQLASMILDQRLKAPPIRAVITTSEKVTPEMREVIEHAFSTKVYEEYGTVEDVFYVCECEHGRKHINPDAGIIEIVDEQMRPVKPGTMGEVLATGFIRPSQPFVRYRVGDLAIMDDQPCPCGRNLPVLSEIVGRLEDTVYAPDGRRMVRFHGIFVNQPHVREGQIIQEKIDLIRVLVVPKDGFDGHDRQDIINRIQQRLTPQMNVQIELVDNIKRTASGKFKAVVCNLSLQERKEAGTQDDA